MQKFVAGGLVASLFPAASNAANLANGLMRSSSYDHNHQGLFLIPKNPLTTIAIAGALTILPTWQHKTM